MGRNTELKLGFLRKICYNGKTMTIHEFIKTRPYLVWYVKDLDKLDEASEAIIM